MIDACPQIHPYIDITVTMHVFDQGKWTTTDDNYGPRWGVGHRYAGGDYVAATIIDKSFLPLDAGYGYHPTTQGQLRLRQGGDAHDHRYVCGAFEKNGFRAHVVVAEHFAVVGTEDDDVTWMEELGMNFRLAHKCRLSE